MKLNQNKSIIGGIIALIVATSCCWIPALTIGLGGATSLLSLNGVLEKFSSILMPIGFFFIAIGVVQVFKNKSKMKQKEIMLNSKITCPNCGHEKEELMPTNACQFFYECEHCKQILKPKEGDCCVFCSYGTIACPPIQADEKCC